MLLIVINKLNALIVRNALILKQFRLVRFNHIVFGIIKSVHLVVNLIDMNAKHNNVNNKLDYIRCLE